MIKTPNAGNGILFKGIMDRSGRCERDRTVSQSASGVEDLRIYRPFLGARTICTMGAKSDSATLKTWQTFPVLVMDKFYFRYFLPNLQSRGPWTAWIGSNRSGQSLGRSIWSVDPCSKSDRRNNSFSDYYYNNEMNHRDNDELL